MGTFLIAALSADGFIAKTRDHAATWTSKEDKEFFKKKTKEAGVIVMGKTTYETIGKPLKDRLNVIYAPEGTSYEGVRVTQADPRELIEDLHKRGFEDIAVCGGSMIYTMFAKAGLLDKLYLTVEPVVFGSGLSLFTEPLSLNLSFEREERLGEGSVLLEYTVRK